MPALSPLHARVVRLQARLPGAPRGHAVYFVRDPNDRDRWLAYYYTTYPTRREATGDTREDAVDALILALDEPHPGDLP
jgi:hypothetical protein